MPQGCRRRARFHCPLYLRNPEGDTPARVAMPVLLLWSALHYARAARTVTAEIRE